MALFYALKIVVSFYVILLYFALRQFYSRRGLYLLKRAELLTTETELIAMAAAAKIGLRSPKAATGISAEL